MDYVFDQCGKISKQLECMDIWRLLMSLGMTVYQNMVSLLYHLTFHWNLK